MQISVIIPALREAPRIAETVRMARALADEVIVVDGGSRDGTVELAAREGARVMVSSPGRGVQLHTGAEAASGDALLFLHADCSLRPEGRDEIEAALSDPEVAGGNFYLEFAPDFKLSRMFATLGHLRRKILRTYYGDSAIFIRKSAYVSLGGFKPYPLFEDYDFCRRLERRFKTAYITRTRVVASSRRFMNRAGRTLTLWLGLQALYSLGASPHWLSKLYRGEREHETR